jgi:hypothetical protein
MKSTESVAGVQHEASGEVLVCQIHEQIFRAALPDSRDIDAERTGATDRVRRPIKFLNELPASQTIRNSNRSRLRHTWQIHFRSMPFGATVGEFQVSGSWLSPRRVTFVFGNNVVQRHPFGLRSSAECGEPFTRRSPPSSFGLVQIQRALEYGASQHETSVAASECSTSFDPTAHLADWTLAGNYCAMHKSEA